MAWLYLFVAGLFAMACDVKPRMTVMPVAARPSRASTLQQFRTSPGRILRDAVLRTAPQDEGGATSIHQR